MSSSRLAAATLLLSFAAVVASAGPAAAAAAIDLGTASSFAVLAGSGITNTGATTITGDVGTFPTPSMTGFDTVTLAGANHGGDAVTQDAKQALSAAYDQAFASAPAASVATELGGSTLTPGVYHGGTLGITGALTLDTQGDPQAVFVFQSDSTLITASASSVIVLGGSTACNVFWQVGSSATFGTDSTLVGSVLADSSISAGDGATFQGRLLARGGAVTLQHNTITARTCAAAAAVAQSSDSAAAAAGASTTSATGGSATDLTQADTSTGAVGPTAPTTPPARTTTATTRRAAGTATGGDRPGLATTGTGDLLPLVGATAVAFGLLLVRLSRPRRALLHADRRVWQAAADDSRSGHAHRPLRR
jgi:hypothetical protein